MKQRFIYNFSSNPLERLVAEINLRQQMILLESNGYLIKELHLLVPKRGFDFIFQPGTFDSLLQVHRDLGGEFELIGKTLVYNFDDLKIQITSKSELFILTEIFAHTCYHFHLPKGERVHVIDVGMNVGIASLYFAGLPYVEKVHAFEPFEPTLRQAKLNLEQNPRRARKIEVHDFGLGDGDAELTVDYNVQNKGVNSSLLKPTRDGSTEKQQIRIRHAAALLKKLLKEHPEHSVVFKIDTEGAEYLIFESLFKEKLPERVKGIVVEWHFDGPAKLEEALLASGFTITSYRLNVNSGLIYAFR